MTEAALQELIDSWENLEFLIEEIKSRPEHLPALMKIALSSDHPKSWRAAWIADKVHGENPALLSPYFDTFISYLKTGNHPGKKRHFLKIISLNEVNPKHIPFLTDYCMKTFTSGETPTGVRVHALQILYNISEKEPGLKPELLAVIEHVNELHPSPGIRSRSRKLAAKLRQQLM